MDEVRELVAVAAGSVAFVYLRKGWRLRLPRVRPPMPVLSRRPPRWWKDAER
jgi:hypothetical protein